MDCFGVEMLIQQVDGITLLTPSLPLTTGAPCFTALCTYRVFHRLKVYGNPVSSKSAGTIFPMAFAHFMTPTHSGNPSNSLNFFIIVFAW